MVSHSLIIFIVGAIFSTILHAKEANQEVVTTAIDWSSFLVQGEMNGLESIDLIMKLPLHYYWDALKASFRCGVIGDKVKDSMAEYVSKVERKLTISGRSNIVESYILDSTALFMNSLAALKYMIKFSDELKQKIPRLNDDQGSYSLEMVEMLLLRNDTLSIPSIEAVTETYHYRQRTVQQKLKNLNEFHRLKLQQLDYKQKQRKHNTDTIHAAILEDIEKHYITLNNSLEWKHSKMKTKALEIEMLNRQTAEDMLRSSHSASLNEFENDLSVVLKMIAYRASEEKDILQQSAHVMKDMVVAKASLMQWGLEEALKTLFFEMQQLSMGLYRDPVLTLQYLAIFVGAMLCLIIVIEISHMMGVLFRKSSRKLHVGDGNATSNSQLSKASKISTFKDLAFPSETSSRLQAICDNLRSAAFCKLPLPNILIAGKSGSGKSTACMVISQIVSSGGMTPRFICGGDLQSLGPQAAIYLREILKAANSSSKPTLLVIEDADSMIRSRNILVKTSDSESSNRSTGLSSDSCLYALLTGLDEISHGLSLLVTTRLSPHEVDSALTDRMGLLVDLSLPCLLSRLRSSLLLLNPVGELYSLADSHAQSKIQSLIGIDHNDALKAAMNAGQIYPNISTTENEVIPNESVAIPENSCPPSGHFSSLGISDPLSSAAANIRANLSMYSDDELDVCLCLKACIVLMEGKSYRDIQKLGDLVRYRVMCSERCKLTSRVWMQELAALIE